MIKRVLAAVTLGMALVGAGALAQTAVEGFSDVPDNHPRAADIWSVTAVEWFGGYPDGTFKPDRTITAEQMARVVFRAYPEGMSRAEFASFMFGGWERVDLNPAGGFWEGWGPVVLPVETPASGWYDIDIWGTAAFEREGESFVETTEFNLVGTEKTQLGRDVISAADTPIRHQELLLLGATAQDDARFLLEVDVSADTFWRVRMTLRGVVPVEEEE